MSIDIKLPQLFYFDDYHEIDYIGKYLKQLSPEIKIEEVGYCGEYTAIVYLKKDEEYKNLVKEFEKIKDDFNSQ